VLAVLGAAFSHSVWLLCFCCSQSVSQLVLEHGGQFNDLKSINNTMDALQWANKNVGNVSDLVENGLTWLDSR